ncbi:MAG: hypothetical protein AAGC85_24430 [Bacteroidota bacterium]
MTDSFSSKVSHFAQILIENMFQVKAGEVVAITADSDAFHDIVFATAKAVEEVGGKPMVIYVPKAEYDGNAGLKVWPVEALKATLSEVDVWIEYGGIVMLYSDIWEHAFKENPNLRYLVIGDTEIDSLIRTFTGFDIPTLKLLLEKVKGMVMQANKIHIRSTNGTDVRYETNPAYAFDIDDGDYSQPIFGTAPGYVNIVPRQGSMSGLIVFDVLMEADLEGENHVEFLMKDGAIVEVKGNAEAEKFSKYLASFDDPNMYKISHNMIGLNPGVRELTGNIVEDERIWGGVDFGFGHTSPMDMPPDGQEAKSHFDGVVGKVSIFLDGEEIIREGEVVHPELASLADKLLS